MNYVYVIQNLDDLGDFYLGSTPDLKRRLREHNSGKGSYPKGCNWRVVYYEAYMSLKAARRRERSLKKGRARVLLMKRIKESLGEVSG